MNNFDRPYFALTNPYHMNLEKLDKYPEPPSKLMVCFIKKCSMWFKFHKGAGMAGVTFALP